MEPRICGHYRVTPGEIADLTMVELTAMLDGLDWINDREWERALFVRTADSRAASDLLDYNYPHFRTERVVKIIRPDNEE